MKYKLNNQLQELPIKPHSSVIKYIDSGKFPFATHKIIGHEPGLLASEEFKRCIESITRFDAPSLVRFLQVKQLIEEKESNYKDELEKIAVETIEELFDIPDFIHINSNIDFNQEDYSHCNHCENKNEPISDERKQEMQDAINSRIFLTSLVHGSAMHIYKSAHYIIDEKLRSIDVDLLALYDEYSSLTNFFLWQNPVKLMIKSVEVKDSVDFSAFFDAMTPMLLENGITQKTIDEVKENPAFKQGYEELDIENNTIFAHAINLPILFHELTKGVIDFLISKGIPQEYTEDELMYYYSQADKYEDEIWHYFIGPSIWIKLMEALKVDTQELPEKISIISQMDYDSLIDLFIPIIDGGEEKIKTKLKLYGLK